MANYVNIPIEVGGGVRSNQDIVKLIEGNVKRVILGTKAIEDKAFLKEVLSLWANKIAVSLDCANGIVAQRGWTQTSNVRAVDFAAELENFGVRCLIYTDIARDGMLKGLNLEGLKELLQAVNIPIIASGGVAGIDDIKQLLGMKLPKLMGVITGKPIYEGKLDLKEAIQLCSQNG